MHDKEFKLLCGIVLFIIVVFGTVGNLVSLVTWRTGRRCKKFAGATYLTALALSDTLVLCTSGLKSVIELIFGINIWHLHEILCKVLHTTWHLFFLISTWVIVSLTIERTVAVGQPLKSSVRTRNKLEILVVFALSLVSLLLQLPFTIGAKVLPVIVKNETSFSTTSKNYNERNRTNVPEQKCQADPSSFYFKYEDAYHNWFMDFALLFSVPLGILLVCNVIILVVVKRRNPALQELAWKRKPEVHSSAMTARVVALCLTLALSVGPYSIAALIPDLMSENKAVSTVFNDRLMMILLLIWYLNNSSNFILYSVTGRAFRRDCAAIFCRRCIHQPLESSTAFNSTRVSSRSVSEQDSYADMPTRTNSRNTSVDDVYKSQRFGSNIFCLSCYEPNGLSARRNSISSRVSIINMQNFGDVW